MAHSLIPTATHALAVVQKGSSFLLIQETKQGEPWYLPAGGVEPGETLAEAAHREVLEEGGIRVGLAGILGIEHAPTPFGARFRVIYLAHPVDDAAPKREPDAESLQARWFALDEMDGLTLRHAEAKNWCQLALEDAPLMPLHMLGSVFRFG